MPGINDESDLGYYYAHEAGIYSEKDLGPLANYIDYERYGRDIAMDEQGRFTDEGYVRVASERWDRQFNGELDDIPDEYRITGSGEAAERDSTTVSYTHLDVYKRQAQGTAGRGDFQRGYV